MLEFVEAERGVERHQGHTLVGRREKGHHPFRPVRQIDRQPVTRFDAETAQRLAERPRLPFDLRIGHPARPEDQELPIWMLLRLLREDRCQMTGRHVCHVPHSVESLKINNLRRNGHCASVPRLDTTPALYHCIVTSIQSAFCV